MTTQEPIDRIEQQSQLPLLPMPTSSAPLFKPPEQERYTAADFLRERPDDYQDIVQRLARGEGLLSIGRVLRASVHVVTEIRDLNPIAIAREREALASRMRAVSGLAVEGIMEDLSDDIRRKKIPADRKAVIAGIMSSNAELLSGGATSRVEHIFDVPTEQDWNRTIDAECSEAMSTHFEGKTSEQKEVAPPANVRPEAPKMLEAHTPEGKS